MTYSAPPAAARSLLDSGLAAHRAGDLERAADMYSQALLVAPEIPDALKLLGTVLLQMGRASEALPNFERAARRLRNDPHLLANLGQCYIALGRHDVAADAFRKATRIEPRDLHLQLGLGSALALQGKYDDARAVFERAAKRAPTSAAVWLNLGNVARDQQRRQDAIDLYSKAVSLDPAMPEALNNLGSALHSKLRFAEAEKQYRECIRRGPDYLIAYFNLASVLMDLGRFAEAEAVARELVARGPDVAEPHGLLGATLGMQHRLLEAHACYERSFQIAPHVAKACETLAMSLMEIGRPEEGLRKFTQASVLGSNPLTTRQLLGGALLAEGAIYDGLSHYRGRHDAVVFRDNHPHVPITQNPLGEMRGTSLCVLAEQGLGDELFFLRYADELSQRDVRITYRAGAKIASLVERLPSISKVITAAEPIPKADHYMLVADLPHALHEYPASVLSSPSAPQARIAEMKRYIRLYVPAVPPPIRIEPLSEKLRSVRQLLAAAGPPPYIGLTWRAGTLPQEQHASNWVLFKALPLESLASALQGVEGTLLALQRAPDASELTRLRELTVRHVHDFSVLNDDLEQMLALLGVIDEYVGVSNTNMHLRAAAGRTARVLVPAPAEWRWMRMGRESPWFPGFAIYRQSLQGDWSQAVARLTLDLANGNLAGPASSIPS